MISLNSSLEELNSMSKDTLMAELGIKYTEVREGFVRARMPVDHRTKQPFGILHGGASLSLAETIASLGSAVLVDLEKFNVRGAAVSANHIGAVSDGFVDAEANLIHQGSITHVWDVEIRDQKGRKISVVRVTIIVSPKQ
ncbi:MAG: hotdog fold thioesterase [Bacteroidales bacterium]|nr:hotdog fold thioesterase [Bacteroidales bacterium]